LDDPAAAGETGRNGIMRSSAKNMMQLHIKNMGPIDTIDVNVDSDLTFIYGKNNIGKSYAITIFYLILKNIAFDAPFINRYFQGFFPLIRFENDVSFKNLGNNLENDRDLDITDMINNYFSHFIEAVFSSNFENSLRNSFGDISNLNNKISNGHFELGLEFDDYNIKIVENKNKLSTKFDGKGRKYFCRKLQRHRNPCIEEQRIVFAYNDENQFSEDVGSYINELYRKSIASILSKINNVYYLPASRSWLYRALNAFSQILAELAKKRSFLREKIVLPSISEQDSDYFSKMNEINVRRINQRYNAVAKDIEEKLLNGSVSFDSTTKQILFHPNNIDINLELLGTSSMIAEVSPIVLYLRHIIGSEDESRRRKTGVPIIFIEEPEAHLHPEAQVALIECFVDLIRTGAKLVITSHSNFIFSKLNNLIADKKIDVEKINGILLFQTTNGSRSKTIPISELGMEDDNFVTTAEKLYAEKIAIIENMENESAE
jgi:predicted ATPase